jgi:hypothetical protein
MVEKKYNSTLCATLKKQARNRTCATLEPHGVGENNNKSLKSQRLRHLEGAANEVTLRHCATCRPP